MSKKSLFISSLLALPLLVSQGYAQPANTTNTQGNSGQNTNTPLFPYMAVRHLPSQDCQLLTTKVNADIHRLRAYIFDGADWFDSDSWGIENRIDTVEGDDSAWDDNEQTDNVKTLLTRDVQAAHNAGCVSDQDTMHAVNAWIERVKTVFPNPVSNRDEKAATRAGIPVVTYVYALPPRSY